MSIIFNLLLILTLFFGLSCNTSVDEAIPESEIAAQSTNMDECEKGECPCETPIGRIQHLNNVTMYSQDQVSCEKSCGEYESVFTCNNGQLIPKNLDPLKAVESTNYIQDFHFFCGSADCLDCDYKGNVIPHRQNITLFSTDAVDCDLSCEDAKQVRTCINGVLSGDDNFRFESCQSSQCRCVLPDGTGFLTLHGKLEFSNVSQAACGNTCADHIIERECRSTLNDGQRDFFFSGDDSYNIPGDSCIEATNCSCDMPGTIEDLANGDTFILSTKLTARCDDSCTGSGISIEVRCDNGTLKNTSNDSIVDIFNTTYLYKCEYSPCDDCQVDTGSSIVQVNHTSSYDFYADSLPCGNSCPLNTSETNALKASGLLLARTCYDGDFQGDSNFDQATCEERICQCPIPGTNPVEYVDATDLDGRDLFSQTSVGCSEDSCSTKSVKRKCLETFNSSSGEYEYTLDGPSNYTFISCTDPLPSDCECEMPGTLPAIADGETEFTLFQNTPGIFESGQAQCGYTCQADVPITKVDCSEGNLTYSADGTPVTDSTLFALGYQHSICNSPTNCECNMPGSLLPIGNNQTKKIATIEEAGCGQTCATEGSEIEVRCENGILKRTSNGSEFSISGTPNVYYCTDLGCGDCVLDTNNDGFLDIVQNSFTHKFYKPNVSCSDDCDTTPDINKDLICDNGSFPIDTTYTKPYCDRGSCLCEDPVKEKLFVGGAPQFLYSDSTGSCETPCEDKRSPLAFKCKEFIDGDDKSYDFVRIDNETTTATQTGFTYMTCTDEVGCSCLLPNGLGSIERGKRTKLSVINQVACGDVCENHENIEVECKGGNLIVVGDETETPVDINAGDFSYNHICQPSPDCKNCELPGWPVLLADGAKEVLFIKENLECGEDLELMGFEFECRDGDIYKSGNLYIPQNDPEAPEEYFNTMNNVCVGCELPWGGILEEGNSVFAYRLTGVVGNGCGKGCQLQERSCKNGILTGDQKFDLPACSGLCEEEGGGAPPRVCLLPWQNTYVTPGADIPMYTRLSVPCEESCQDYFAVGKCDIETGTFDIGFDYIHKNCTERCPGLGLEKQPWQDTGGD